MVNIFKEIEIKNTFIHLNTALKSLANINLNVKDTRKENTKPILKYFSGLQLKKSLIRYCLRWPSIK